MTKKIAVSLPDDVADRLSLEPNVSAFVARAVRRQMAGEKTREMLASAGFVITDEDIAEAHAEMEQLRARITPELREQAARLQAEVLAARAGARVTRATVLG
ncbi:hypothetical protein [Micromonospora chokoriensis]|uniref:Uncharacterized protein n=1 Tax=Micromonospora chokoriensis TaxID=356851 RepID=A0A1C4WFW3_9ACTN|nr:hypothetical protein [Micromonospora chokoriensis]SCE95107.1 hypothetical protein GA0070612_2438 [Micromonospora chokoriensis]